MFHAFVESLVPPVYLTHEHPMRGGGGGGGVSGPAGRRGSSAPLPRWQPHEHDAAFFTRLAPSVRFFNALVNHKLNRLNDATLRYSMGFRRPRLDTSFLSDDSSRLRVHVAIPPPIALPPVTGSVDAALQVSRTEGGMRRHVSPHSLRLPPLPERAAASR